MKKLRAD